MKKCVLSFILAVVMLLGVGSSALAIANPDSISIGDVYAFESVLEDGDILVYMREDVSYASQPSEDSEDTFLMAIYDTDGTTLLFSRALNYYQHNMISIYLDADDNTLVSGTAYKVRVMGNPAIFELEEGTTMDTRVLTAGDYRESADLAGIIVAQAEIFEDDWGTTLLSSNDKLNSTGSYYFLKAIPGLSAMIPSVFSLSSSSLTYTRNTSLNTSGLNQTRDKNPVSLNSALAGLSAMFGITNDPFGEFGWYMFFALVVAGVAYAATRRPDIALLGGAGGVLAVGAYVGVADGQIMMFLMAIGTVLIVMFALEYFVPRYG